MAVLYISRSLTRQAKQQAIETITKNAEPDIGFYLLVIGAALLAASGIFMDSIPVLIASMIIAPLSYPILGLSLGAVQRNSSLLWRSLCVLIMATALSVLLAILVTLLCGSMRVPNIFITFSPNWLLAAFVALVAGGVGAYGVVSPKVSDALIGVAIAVSLMPPLVDSGVELANENIASASGAFTIFFLNVACILVASAFVFTAIGIRKNND